MGQPKDNEESERHSSTRVGDQTGVQHHHPEAASSHRPIQSELPRPSVKSSFWSSPNHWMAVFTGVLTFIAVFQLIASQEATKAANEAVKISEESLRVSQESYRVSEQTMKLAERAWVMAKDASIIGPIEVGKTPTVKVTFHNSGRSPALKTKMRHSITVLHMNNVPDLAMPDIKIKGEESITVMGPDSIASSEIALDTPLSKEAVLHLKHKEWVIMTYGLVTYFDTFEAKHETRFCLIWRNIEGGALSPCDKWNDAN